MSDNIHVSICCLTFNHAPFIRECLDGFLMQECDFKYEILIHDDASTDGTQEIIKEYQTKFPEIIKPIFQNENQYSKGQKRINSTFNFPRAKGKYIALCEGDDYWTDSLKLKKQIDFMEKNESICFSFHNCLRKLEEKNSYIPYAGLQKFKDKDIIEKSLLFKRLGGAYPTASAIFEKSLLQEFEKYSKYFVNGDSALIFSAIAKGEIGYLADKMGVYRTSDANWSAGNNHFPTKRKNYEKFVDGMDELSKIVNNRSLNKYLKITISHSTYQILLAHLMYENNKKDMKELFLKWWKRLSNKDLLKFIYRWFTS